MSKTNSAYSDIKGPENDECKTFQTRKLTGLFMNKLMNEKKYDIYHNWSCIVRTVT